MCQSSAWNCVTAICPRLAASLSRHRPCIILFERIIIAVIRTYVPVNPFTVTAVDCSTRWITKDDWCRATGRSAALQRHTWKQTGERKYRAESSTPLQTPRVFLVSKNCNKYTSCIFFCSGSVRSQKLFETSNSKGIFEGNFKVPKLPRAWKITSPGAWISRHICDLSRVTRHAVKLCIFSE